MPEYEPTYPDIDKDVAITAIQYMLSPDIPPAERAHFEKFYLMFSKIMALGNIRRTDIFTVLLAFEEICILLEIGLYEEARQMMGKELTKMQLSRSVGGFQILYGQQGVQRSESLQKVLTKGVSTSKPGLLRRLTRRKETPEEGWEVEG